MKNNVQFFIILIFFLLGHVNAQTNYHVTTQGGGTGLSWESPTTLDEALKLANTNDIIHLAAGAYVPEKPIAKLKFDITVKDASNNPVNEAYIILFHQANTMNERSAEGKTDVNGNITLLYYPESSVWTITIAAADYEPQKIVVTLNPNADNKLTITLQPKTSMSVLSYNVLEGFKNLANKNTQFAAWVKTYNPDVILFQELNGFTDLSLVSFAATYGHTYSVLLKTTGYPTGITSKYPITDIKKVLANFVHGYVSAKINGINFFSIHLTPNALGARIIEGNTVLNSLSPLLLQDERIIVAGDFNSYNAFDEQAYGPNFKQERPKYNPSTVDYTVTNAFLSAGMIDSYPLRNTIFKATVIANVFWITNPNKGMRYDYQFMDQTTAGKCTYVDIIQDSYTDNSSDHYPVLMRFYP